MYGEPRRARVGVSVRRRDDADPRRRPLARRSRKARNIAKASMPITNTSGQKGGSRRKGIEAESTPQCRGRSNRALSKGLSGCVGEGGDAIPNGASIISPMARGEAGSGR